MSEWRQATLGDFVRLQRGHDLTEAQRSEGSVPVIGSAGQNGWHGAARCKGPGVTIGRSGASAGVVTFVPQDYWPHNTVLYVTDFLGNDPLFAAFMLKTLPLAELNSGSAQASLNRNFLYHVPVIIPPVEAQRRIASILGAYDDLIEVNRRRIAVLEEMARGLFEEWFVRFRFPGHEAVPILDTQDGPLPEGWRWGTLADIGRTCGKSLNPSSFPDETFAHYSLPAFDRGRSPVADKGNAIKSNKVHFDEPVVLASKLNPRIPRVWFVPRTTEIRQLASTEFVPIKPDNGLPLAYVFAIVSGEQFRDRLVGMAGGTSTSHQRVKPKDILSTPVALAPRQLVIEAGKHLTPVYELAVQLEAANRSLATSRDLLLPRLISGQLSVAEAERHLEEAA